MLGDDLPLLRGTLDLLVLKAISGRPTHGFGIATWLEKHTRGEVTVEDSALYQALHRLEAKRLVSAAWGVTPNNRRARFYRLTATGEKRLVAEAETWQRYTRLVSRLLAAAPAMA